MSDDDTKAHIVFDFFCTGLDKNYRVFEISVRDFNTNKSHGEISKIVSHGVLELPGNFCPILYFEKQ